MPEEQSSSNGPFRAEGCRTSSTESSGAKSSETVYRVVRDPGCHPQGFYVEVTKPGQPMRVTDSFSTIGAAYSWVDQAKEQEAAGAKTKWKRWLRFFRRA